MAKRIYLDHASTTPMDKRVFKAMKPYMLGEFGNPSALYKEALVAKQAVGEARKTVARHLNVRVEEVLFTGSGTEADNLALAGIVKGARQYFEARHITEPVHIIVSAIEHPGILEMARSLEKEGVVVSYVPVLANGIINIEEFKKNLRSTTVLVSVMLANNEIGTIQPIRELSRVIQEYRKNTEQPFPYLHTDASQAANYLDLSFQKLGCDAMTLDGSKIYGPKGIGILAVKKHVPLKPVVVGGGQERGLRSGTENVPSIVGFAKA